ncbi:hypothetical protein BGZ65_007427 [Modicella reniformis]|uniref:Uncharacterized protein n=1 Tax=Modicella reniformis TaxID=1440133 RepID=A0A9P6IJF1_9FUNG|nr:hypothetical protein BGZ65_007427 [Modicella reniformis]
MSNAAVAPSRLSSALEQIRKLIKDRDSLGLLSTLSDVQWLHDTELQLELSRDIEIMSQLLNLTDVYLQFTVYRLLMAVLLNARPPPGQVDVLDPDGRRLVLFVQMLVRKLDDPHEEARGQQRAILELFHGLFKHHRHLVRSQRNNRDKLPLEGHVACLVISGLTQPSTWESIFGYLIKAIETQHATLTLLIDIEKAWPICLYNEMLRNDVILCYEKMTESIDQVRSGAADTRN